MDGPGKQGRDAAEISAIMRSVRSTNTTPEIRFQAALDARGITYEAGRNDLPGKPDIVVPERRLLVFIDGDYWHGGQWRRRGLTALEDQFANTASGQREYWLKKIRRNMARDARTTAALLAQDWTVLRFWESDIKRELERCVDMTLDLIHNGAAQTPFALLPQQTVAEFFAGIGLMRMGLERQGWRVVWANDFDPNKQMMYNANFADSEWHFHPGDVNQIDVSDVPPVTLATASFPCTDLSLAGGRNGIDGAQSSAFWGFARVLEQMAQRPPLVLIENVTGLITSHQGDDFERLLQTLNALGYAVDAFVLDAAHFTPQSRERLFIVGVSQSIAPANDALDELMLNENGVRPKALRDFILRRRALNWRITRLPRQPELTTNLESILEDLPDDAAAWWSPARATYLLNQMSLRHRQIAEAMIAAEKWSYGAVFRRTRNGKSMAELRSDGLAGCLRTPKGGSAKQIIFRAGYGRYYARLLTAREAARLMGAGDYNITVGLDQALFGFGDAVCVPVVEWITTYYLNPLVNELIHNQPLAVQR